MSKKYIYPGDGYWCDAKDPSRGGLGIPKEIEQQRTLDFEAKKILEQAEESAIVSKAKALLERYPYTNNSTYQREFLARLGFKGTKIIGGKASLEAGEDRNVYKMYNKTINQISEIIRNPKKNTSLINRILSAKLQ